MPLIKLRAGKWITYWCWMKNRAYICERPASGPVGPEDSTFTSSEEQTQTSATTASCTVDDECYNRAGEIEQEINATKIGYRAVIATVALRNATAGKTWLGGSASFADLAQSAINFGRNFARLSAEVRPRL